MKEVSLDIFCGVPGKNAMWLEAVVGLSNARERMEQIAAEKPGQYFVYSVESRAVVAQTETGSVKR